MPPRLEPLAPGQSPELSDAAARAVKGTPKGDDANALLEPLRHRMEELQLALGAEDRRALLVVLQGRDAAGKDGTIKRVFGDLNPAYCRVSNFKRPTPLELRHDFLWRVHQQVPPAGVIGVFNRSHYEDVLAVRVHQLVPEASWRKRYAHINEFERMLVDHGVTILKFFLHISKEEQRERLEERLADPTKNWKFDPGDLAERKRWEAYTEAYQDMFLETGTVHAPWYLVPSDQKSVRDLMIAEVVVDTLERIDPQYPDADPAVLAFRGKIR